MKVDVCTESQIQKTGDLRVDKVLNYSLVPPQSEGGSWFGANAIPKLRITIFFSHLPGEGLHILKQRCNSSFPLSFFSSSSLGAFSSFCSSSSSLSFSFANPPNTASASTSASTSTPVLPHTDTRATVSQAQRHSLLPPKPTGSSGSVWSRGPNAPDISRSVWSRTKSLSRTPQAGHVWARNCELQIGMGARGPEHMRAGTNAGKNVRMPAR